MAYLTILDYDEEYLLNLQRYLQEQKLLDYEIQTFSKPKQFELFNQTHRTEILLADSDFLESLTVRPPCDAMFILSGNEEIQDECSLYKYQSAAKLMAEVIRRSREGLRIQRGDRQVRFTGLFARSHPLLKLYTGISMVLRRNKDRRVLYLCLNPFDSAGEWMGIHGNGSISDILYYTMQKNGDPMPCLLRERITTLGCDLIPPSRNPEELREIDPAVWKRLFAGIAASGQYDEVIVEIDAALPYGEDMLQWMDAVLYPIRSGDVSAEVDRKYLEYLCGRYPVLKERLSVLAVTSGIPQSPPDPEELPQCDVIREISSYVR